MNELVRLCRMADDSSFDELDDYVEAHVHGPVLLHADDVDALVLDPCFIGTAVEEAAGRLGCRIEYHAGFSASPEDFDQQFRGPSIVELSRSLGEQLTPRVVGRAARSGQFDLQAIKQVWHCLARFGRR